MAGRMSVRQYLKPIDGLPDPKGSLSTTIPSAAIASANWEVQKAISSGKKRGPYKKYLSEALLGSLLHANTSPTAAAHIFYIHGNLSYSKPSPSLPS